MSTVARVSAEIELRDKLSRPLGEASRGIKRFADKASNDFEQANRAANKTWKEIGDGFARTGQRMQLVGAGLTLGLTGPIVLFGKKAVQAASDFAESTSKMEQVFGKATDTVREFSKNSAESFGLSKQAAIDYASSFGLILQAGGQTEEASAKLSVGLAKLAADLASFYNVDIATAADKLKSGLVGEAEPLRAFGILLSETAVKNKALAMGFKETSGQLSEAAKVQARYQIILDQSTKAQGDFARTAGGMANQQRILQAELQNLGVEMGQSLLPVAKEIVKVLRSLSDWFKNLSAEQKKAVVQILAVTAALGPLLVVFGSTLQAMRAGIEVTMALSKGYAALKAQILLVQGAQAAAAVTTTTTATATAGATAATTGLTASLLAAAAPLAVYLAAIAAVGLAIWGLKTAWDNAVNAGIKSREEMEREWQEYGRGLDVRKRMLESQATLVQQYEALRAKKKLTKEEAERLAAIYDKLAALNPSLVKGYNEQGTAIGGLTTSYKNLEDQILRTAEAQRQFSFVEQFGGRTEAGLDALNKAKERLKELETYGVRVQIGTKPQTQRQTVDDGTGRMVTRDVPIPGTSQPVYEMRREGKEFNQAIGAAKTAVRELTKAYEDLKKEMTSASRASKGLNPDGTPKSSGGGGGGGGPAPMGGTLNVSGGAKDTGLKPMGIDPEFIAQANRELEEQKRRQEEVYAIENQLEVERAKARGDRLKDILSLQEFGKVYDDLTDVTMRNKVEAMENLEVFRQEQDVIRENLALEQQRANQKEQVNQSIIDQINSMKREVDLINATTEEERLRWEVTNGGLQDALPWLKDMLLVQAGLLDQARAAKAAYAAWFGYWQNIIKAAKEFQDNAKKSSQDKYDEYLKDLTTRLLELTTASDELLRRDLREQFKGLFPEIKDTTARAAAIEKAIDNLLNQKKFVEQAERTAAVIQGLADSMEDVFMRAFDGLLENGVKGFINETIAGVRDMVRQIAMEMLKLQAKRAVMWLVGQIAGAGAASSAGGGVSEIGAGGIMPAMARGGGGGNGGGETAGRGATIINVTVHTPNVQAFRRSEGQAMGEVFAKAARQKARSGQG